jgi:tetratricopeptide (TPR) repeat protein
MVLRLVLQAPFLLIAILLVNGCASAPDDGYCCEHYWRNGQYDLLITNITQKLETPSGAMHSAQLYSDRGEAYRLQGKFDQAIADFRKALEVDPNYYLAWNNLGLTYKGKGELNEAIACYTKALKINPKFGIAYNNRARAYELLKQPDKAADDDNRARQLGFKYRGSYTEEVEVK